jgi:hypothetical protein
MPITGDSNFTLLNSPNEHATDKAIRLVLYLSEHDPTIVRVELAVGPAVISTTAPRYETDFADLTMTDLIAEDANAQDYYDDLMAAAKAAVVTRLEAVAANSGVTFTES